MEKYYYECKSYTCGHLHRSEHKTYFDECEKCNHNEVQFFAMYKIKE